MEPSDLAGGVSESAGVGEIGKVVLRECSKPYIQWEDKGRGLKSGAAGVSLNDAVVLCYEAGVT